MRALILLPPSEGMAEGGTGPGWDPAEGRFGALATERAAVARLLAAVMAGPAPATAKLLGVGGAHLARAVAANAAVVGAPTSPACERYRGVVHTHLDTASLSPSAADRAADELVVVSGLLGLVGWHDPVPDHRLKMGARLGELGRLSRWWRAPIRAQLDPLATDRPVVDLLPAEHADALEPAGPPRLRVRFTDAVPGGGTRRASGHAAKAVKGRLARHLVERSGDVAAALASFAAEGWTFDEAASDLDPGPSRGGDAVYVRSIAAS